MPNKEIKEKIKNEGIKYWQIAYELGITDSTFSRKLRKEMTSERKEEIFSIIKRLKEGEKNEQYANNVDN